MQRAARTDKNQTEIVEALRKVGANVLITSQLKNAFDILVGYRGNLYIMEIKDGARSKLTDGEQKCKDGFNRVGVDYHIVRNIDEALIIIGNKENYSKQVLKELILDVADLFNTNRTELKSNSRKAENVLSRQLVMYILRKRYPELTLEYIGLIFRQDHSTVVHSLKTIEQLLNGQSFTTGRGIEFNVEKTNKLIKKWLQ